MATLSSSDPRSLRARASWRNRAWLAPAAACRELLAEAGIGTEGQAPWDMLVHDERVFERLLREGTLGLGEAYMDGLWDCARLDELFCRALRGGLEHRVRARWDFMLAALANRVFNRQSLRRAFEVGERHYDLGNDLFTAMLDPAMQYSCGYWARADNLVAAQQAKLELIADKLRLVPGMRVLDIGCGWGGLAEFLARRHGVSVVGVTVSKEQAGLARTRCAGLAVDIRLADYRSLDESFDRIVSVGMFEHVGPKNYRRYFEVAHRCLRRDGIFLLHTIGALKPARAIDPWIDKYIFPNGMLPALTQIGRAAEGLFVMEDWHNFGADYDRTLMAWAENFRAAWPALSEHYDLRFRRMFEYYLLSCAGAFRARDLQLWQIVFSPGGLSGGYRAPR